MVLVRSARRRATGALCATLLVAGDQVTLLDRHPAVVEFEVAELQEDHSPRAAPLPDRLELQLADAPRDLE
jgi:hypothetical protein